jgi:hypothetical protein
MAEVLYQKKETQDNNAPMSIAMRMKRNREAA